MQDYRQEVTNKDFLLSIIDNNYEIPDNVEPFPFAQALMQNFSSTDGELRDEMSYMLLASGIIDRQKLSPAQLEKLLAQALDQQHLFFRIGEVNTDSVFMRSFSNLIVAAILYSDSRKPAFQPSTIKGTRDALVRYAHQERDWRGYIEGKGWAHAMAHLADALDECAQNPTMTAQDRKEILQTLSKLVTLPEALYHEEDIRLATIAYHIILGRQLDDNSLSAWLKSCYIPREPDVASWTRITNAKNFLRSLYFLLYWDGAAPVITEQIATILKQLDDVYLEKRSDA
jgi:hypothetical protein